MSLYNLIKQDTYTLNKTNIPRLQRRVQKLANAGQRSIAYCALLDEQNQFLTKINNEAKVRRSTKSVVLGKGKAKVMSYKDIEEARATRAAKDATKARGKRGRKRKNAALATDEPEAEAEPEVARTVKEVIIITGKRKRGRKRKSAVQEADEPEPEQEVAQNAPEPWRAPVARMY
jgi:hypothetical protein